MKTGQASHWELSAGELRQKIAQGELTALEAVEAHIARIEEVNGALNAVCWKRYDEARAEAREADALMAAGKTLGPLHGVPITIKECLDLSGTPSTFGASSRAQALATGDDPYVARLRRAGAIILGKTNVAQLLLFVETDNPLYGRTNNPWDLGRTPGGSSGGQAAIIAAGGSPLGLGTDIGGSSRVPAAFCGIVGFKPTAGRLPDQGRYSIPIGQRAVVSQVGLLAREVADLALALEVANGGRDPALEPPMPLGDMGVVDLRQLRIAYFTEDGTLSASLAARRAVRETARMLAGMGAQVVEWQPPEMHESLFLLFALLAGDGGRGIRRTLGSGPRDPRIKLLELAAGASAAKLALLRVLLRLSGRSKAADSLRFYGRHSTDEHWQLVEQQMSYQQRWRRALDESEGGPFDLILSPASALPAVQHGATAELGVIGAYACVYNVLGYPAGVLPLTRVQKDEEKGRPRENDKMDRAAAAADAGSAGLPIGVQFAARPWREHVALAAMAAVERAARARADYPNLSELWRKPPIQA